MTDVGGEGELSGGPDKDDATQPEPGDVIGVDTGDIGGEGEPSESTDSPRYLFSPDHVHDASRILDAAFADLIDGWEGWGAVTQAVDALGSPLESDCVDALGRLAGRPLSLEPDGRPGAELKAGDMGAAMPDVPEVSSDEVLLWTALADLVSAPAAVARIHDLLFLRREGDVGRSARQAAQAYVAATLGRPNDLDTTTYLLRAWTLARLVKGQDLEQSALLEIERRATALVDSATNDRPGVLHPLVAALCEPPLDRTQAERLASVAASLLATMAERETRGHLATDIAKMRRRLLAQDAAAALYEQISRDEVAGYLRDAEAESRPAAVRMHFLESAARLATKRGLTDLAREIAATMQATGRAGLEWQKISVEGKLPPWVSESHLDEFTRGQDWRLGMRYLLQSPPPSGEVQRLRSAAKSGRGGLRRLFPTAIYGSDGLPRATLSSEADQDLNDMALGSRISAEYQGLILAVGLARIRDKFGTPSLDELTTFILEFGASDPRLARSLAKGFIHFWNGDSEAAVAMVVPKVEAAARGLLRELDEGIYRVQVSQSQGGYPGLHVLIGELEKVGLDEDWAWFLRWLLLGPAGQNIRNKVAHGFISDLSPTYTALVLRAAAVLIVMSPVLDGEQRSLSPAPSFGRLDGPSRHLDAVAVGLSKVGLRLHQVSQHVRNRLRQDARG